MLMNILYWGFNGTYTVGTVGSGLVLPGSGIQNAYSNPTGN